MAAFTSTADLNIDWRGTGFQFVGKAGTEFHISGDFVDSFNAELAPHIPGLVWTSTEDTIGVGGIFTGPVNLRGPVYDVVAYGAKGDGLTSDSAAVNAAIAAAPTGSTIYFPPGTYVLTTGVSSTNKALNFEGYGATLKAGADGLNAWAIYIGDGSATPASVSIRGIRFDSASRARMPVALFKVTDVWVEDCYFTGYSYAHGYDANDGCLRISSAARAKVTNCTFKDYYYGNGGPNLHRGISADSIGADLTVTGCTFDTGDQGIVTTCSGRALIANNSFYHLSDNGVYFVTTGVDAPVFTGNVFNDCEEALVIIGGIGAPNVNTVITGNRFEAWTNKAIALAGDITGLTITGNTFSCTTAGVLTWRTQDGGIYRDITFSGNVVTGVGASGTSLIRLLDTYGFTMVGNRINVVWAAGTNFWVRWDAGTVSDVVVAHNSMQDPSGAGARIRVNATTSKARILFESNVMDANSLIEFIAEASYVNQAFGAGNVFYSASARKQVEGTAIPTGGTWARGDIVWNSAPSAAAAPGWVCTAAGTPGTWKAMANLAA